MSQRVLAVFALVLSCLLVGGCAFQSSNETDPFQDEYDAHVSGAGASAVSEATKFYDGGKSVKIDYNGSSCPSNPPLDATNCGATQLVYSFGYEYLDCCFYSGAYYFPKAFLGQWKGHLELLRWDNIDDFGSNGDKGGVAITGVHSDDNFATPQEENPQTPDWLEARLFRGPITATSTGQGLAFIGGTFRIPVGRWVSITVQQTLRGSGGTGAINKVFVNGAEALSAPNEQNSEGRGFDRVVFGLPQMGSVQAGTPLSFYFDRAFASNDAPPPPARPNILVIVTDDQRFGTTGPDWMVKLRRWFREGYAPDSITGGTAFQNAFATTPECCPSRASILSGRYPHNHHFQQQGVEDEVSQANITPVQTYSLQTYLKTRRGYLTGAFGKYFNQWDIGRDGNGGDPPLNFDEYAISDTGSEYCPFTVFEGEEAHPELAATNGHGVAMPANSNGPRCADDQPTDNATRYFANRAANFIQESNDPAKDATPWFLYVAPPAPHFPSIPEEQYADVSIADTQVASAFNEIDVTDKHPFVERSRINSPPGSPACCTNANRPSQAVLNEQRKDQLRTLLSVDDLVHTVLQKVRDTGEENNTLAIFVSDNGYSWGEHYLEGKLHPYSQSIRVPMFMRWPGRVATNAVDSRLIGNIDIATTIMDAVEAPIVPALEPKLLPPADNPPVDGKSILDPTVARQQLLLEYKQDTPPIGAAGQLPSWGALRGSNFQYIRYNDPAYPGGFFKEYYTGLPNMLDNLYGGDGVPDTGDPDPLDGDLDAALSCQGAACP